MTRNGFHDAEVVVDDRLWPLVGVPTGRVSGFDVLDIDPAGLDWFRENMHRFPETRCHKTPRGGLHLLFLPNASVGSHAETIGPGIDTRGSGGYIIWWPRQGGPVEYPQKLAPWPEWLLAKIKRLHKRSVAVQLKRPNDDKFDMATSSPPPPRGVGKKTVARFSREESYARAAVGRARQRVSEAPVGTRDQTLNREAYALGQLSGAGWVDRLWCEFMLMAGIKENRAVNPETGKTFVQEHGEGHIRRKVERAVCDGEFHPQLYIPARSASDHEKSEPIERS
jgi:hypothetical protein